MGNDNDEDDFLSINLEVSEDMENIKINECLVHFSFCLYFGFSPSYPSSSNTLFITTTTHFIMYKVSPVGALVSSSMYLILAHMLERKEVKAIILFSSIYGKQEREREDKRRNIKNKKNKKEINPF
uniref:Uncharacterized protein n=1 Tax=Glossina austeni TaxID=7395 RepID=A0A1A9UXN6_GLOAU